MKNDYSSLLELMKMHRRDLVDRLENDDDPKTAKMLGEAHLAILAIEAVMSERPSEKTGPKIEFDEKGWPIAPA
ncbi:hypothetical protein DKP76_01540 [Falsochrobactrum shanghaiense]|uniref:Uncharacterized protein n=1 Tax=Falsochrobactrum shanghaiense TaxID=2201899 RepID=A0A316JDE9_9HYPH|nr:hypothetical protein [Falsochrobactrum shanghaiense]PWL19271.1 hypothetical protein DKP76_01540 [Falsochrobactrum shanghaiense]